MTEENKANDDAGVKEKLPEFKITKKISKVKEKKSGVEEEKKEISLEDSGLQKEVDDSLKLSNDADFYSQNLDGNLSNVAEKEDSLTIEQPEENFLLFDEPEEETKTIQPDKTEEELELNKDKAEYKSYIELQRHNATKYAFRFTSFFMILWVGLGVLYTYNPELFKEIMIIFI
mmetsp:Transcript_20918/g.18549  ORF Transcript_20918/g.18549 Transcript_20918/m.18549 type:complete len:174 (+) Transcript_20918:497-1018(+)